MRAAIEGPGDQIMRVLDVEQDNLRGVLERFGNAYLGFIPGDEVLALTRTAVAEGAGSPLGAHLFAQGPGRATAAFKTFFAAQVKRGRLRAAPLLSVPLQFKSLSEAGFLEEALYGAAFQVKRREAVAARRSTHSSALTACQALPLRVRNER